MIQLFSNTLGKDELAAVGRCFDSRWVGRGQRCQEFEAAFAQYIGVDSVLLFNSCTAATFALIKALGIGVSDEVLVPSVQFLGVVNAIIAARARPVFCDVDPRTLAILPSEIERRRSRSTRAVFMLHYGGHPAPMAEIREAAAGLYVLEDAANAVASEYAGQHCGTIGDGGVWSFDAMKELVMGDGGALRLRDEAARRRAYELRYFGLPPKDNSGIDASSQRNMRWWEFELTIANAGRHTSNDIAASIGLVQLTKLGGFIERRREIWNAYQERLADIVDTPPEPENGTASYYLYWIQTRRRDELARYLLDHDIYATLRYYPLHMVQAYQCGSSLPNAERVAERTLCLPLHQNLSDSDVEKVINTVTGFFRRQYGRQNARVSRATVVAGRSSSMD